VDQPNPIRVVWNILRVLRANGRPEPVGVGTVDHSLLSPVLSALGEGGLPAVAEGGRDVATYLAKMSGVEPDTLSRDEALAYWLKSRRCERVRLRCSGSPEGSVATS